MFIQWNSLMFDHVITNIIIIYQICVSKKCEKIYVPNNVLKTIISFLRVYAY